MWPRNGPSSAIFVGMFEDEVMEDLLEDSPEDDTPEEPVEEAPVEAPAEEAPNVGDTKGRSVVYEMGPNGKLKAKHV